MHAGLVRARGDVVVTMDADLQNVPEDLPRLIAAVEDGTDVASGRRVGREDSWGRTLPSKLINGMLRRFTGVGVSDFGCAFNAYSRSALEPVLGVIGKQKFTKALVLSAGASVVEVDLTHQARADSSRYSPFRLIRLALHVLAGFWPQPIQWAGVLIGSICGLLTLAVGIWGIAVWVATVTSPGCSSWAASCSACSPCRASSWRSSASIWGGSSATSKGGRSTIGEELGEP